MTTPQEPLVLDAVLARNERASDTVAALCNGTERWVMRVPAQPDRDPDLVISASLNDVPALVAELRRARDDAAELRAALLTLVSDLEALMEESHVQLYSGDGLLVDTSWGKLLQGGKDEYLSNWREAKRLAGGESER